MATESPEKATPRWRLDPEEIPPELRDTFLQTLTTLTDEEEAVLAELAEMDRLDP
jgi:hypothetical protein